MMTDLDFKGGELKTFINCALEEGVVGNHLHIKFREGITVTSLTHGMVSQRLAL